METWNKEGLEAKMRIQRKRDPEDDAVTRIGFNTKNERGNQDSRN